MISAARNIHLALVGKYLQGGSEVLEVLDLTHKASYRGAGGYCLPVKTKSGNIRALPLSNLDNYFLFEQDMPLSSSKEGVGRGLDVRDETGAMQAAIGFSDSRDE